jgi:putative membrane protein
METTNIHEHDDHDHDHHETTFAQDAVKTIVLLGLGLYLIYSIASGDLNNYINNRFAWLSYVAAALFLLLGVSSAYALTRSRADSSHHHHSLSWPSLFIISVPLLLGIFIPSRPLGASAVGSGVSVNAGTGASTNVVDIRPQDRNVLDWLRAFYNAQNPDSFNGQQADVIGFVYSEPRFGANQFMVARFAISCCVADARAIGLPVFWAQTANLKQGDWVHVKGAFQSGTFEGDTMPILQAVSVDPTTQPDHPYVYP